MSLDSIGKRAATCRQCYTPGQPLLKAPTAFVGPGYHGVLLIGESPHKDWIISGNPFISSKGKLLPSAKNIQKYLEILGLGLDDVALLECAKCVVSERKNLPKMVENCSGFLAEQVVDLKPSHVILLGQKTVEACASLFDLDLAMLSSTVAGNYKIISLYHPSPINPHNHKRNLEFLKTIPPMS